MENNDYTLKTQSFIIYYYARIAGLVRHLAVEKSWNSKCNFSFLGHSYLISKFYKPQWSYNEEKNKLLNLYF